MNIDITQAKFEYIGEVESNLAYWEVVRIPRKETVKQHVHLCMADMNRVDKV